MACPGLLPSMRICATLLSLLLAAFFGAGCQNTSPAPEPSPTPASASDAGEAARWAMLAARTTPLRDAWDVLTGHPYARQARTEQRLLDGTLEAFVARAWNAAPGTARRLAVADSGGAFTYGHFQMFTSEVFPSPDPDNVGALALALADEPLLPQNTLAYVYRQRADTSIDGRTRHVFEARAHPTRGDGHNVRRLTFFVDPATNDLTGLSLMRVDLGTFFREESTLAVELTPLPDGLYIPALTHLRSESVMPFQPRRPITTTARYRLGATTAYASAQ